MWGEGRVAQGQEGIIFIFSTYFYENIRSKGKIHRQVFLKKKEEKIYKYNLNIRPPEDEEEKRTFKK